MLNLDLQAAAPPSAAACGPFGTAPAPAHLHPAAQLQCADSRAACPRQASPPPAVCVRPCAADLRAAQAAARRPPALRNARRSALAPGGAADRLSARMRRMRPVRVLTHGLAPAPVISKRVVVNGTGFNLTLTEPVIEQVKTLKGLYAAAYEDPDAFEEASSEISSLVREIAVAVEPAASDSDLDGLMQEIIRVVDNKDAEVARQRSSHEAQTGGRPRSHSKRR